VESQPAADDTEGDSLDDCVESQPAADDTEWGSLDDCEPEGDSRDKRYVDTNPYGRSIRLSKSRGRDYRSRDSGSKRKSNHCAEPEPIDVDSEGESKRKSQYCRPGSHSDSDVEWDPIDEDASVATERKQPARRPRRSNSVAEWEPNDNEVSIETDGNLSACEPSNDIMDNETRDKFQYPPESAKLISKIDLATQSAFSSDTVYSSITAMKNYADEVIGHRFGFKFSVYGMSILCMNAERPPGRDKYNQKRLGE
jgi:hypothetical protein